MSQAKEKDDASSNGSKNSSDKSQTSTQRQKSTRMVARKIAEEDKRHSLPKKVLAVKTGSTGQINKVPTEQRTFALHKLKARFQELVDRLVEFSNLDIALVKNIAIYAKSLTCAESNTAIDAKVFQAQMVQTFGIGDTHMLEMIYITMRADKRNKFISVEEYSRLICIFVSGDFKLQGPFVFRVYDYNGDDVIDRKELNLLLQPSVRFITEDNEDENGTMSTELNELVNVTMNILDLDEDGHIDIDEFTTQVHKDPLLLECLGQCLPTGTHLEAFLNLILDKKTTDVAKIFENERRKCLHEPKPIRNKAALYPFELELF